MSIGPVFGCARVTILDSDKESPNVSISLYSSYIKLPFGVINTLGVILSWLPLTRIESSRLDRRVDQISDANFSPDSALNFFNTRRVVTRHSPPN